MTPELLDEDAGRHTRQLARWVLSLGLLRSVVMLALLAAGVSLLLRLGIHLGMGTPWDGAARFSFLLSGLIPVVVVATTAPFLLRLLMELERVRMRLLQLAVTDGLTGALNRLAFMSRAEQLVQAALGQNASLALLMIDVDFFKAINDQHGHSAGDEALAAVAARCKAQLRSSDLFARYGGEEFVALLLDTEHAVAVQVAERIRQAVDLQPVAVQNGARIRVTVSMGVALLPAQTSLRALLHCADQNLYRAKSLGRNQVAAERLPADGAVIALG